MVMWCSGFGFGSMFGALGAHGLRTTGKSKAVSPFDGEGANKMASASPQHTRPCPQP